MATLNVEEAAKYLKMDEQVLCAKARAGEIPGSKPSRRWVFIEEDLIAYLRSIQKKPATLTTKLLNASNKKCQSLEEVKTVSVGSDLATVDKEYKSLLGLATS